MGARCGIHVLCEFKVSSTSFNYMMTSSNGNIFWVTGLLCGDFTGPGEFPTQRPVTWNFDVFFDLRLNKRLSKQPWGWWFEMPSWSLWRQCNVSMSLQLGSQRCCCLFTWFCHQQMAKPGNKTATPPWPNQNEICVLIYCVINKFYYISLLVYGHTILYLRMEDDRKFFTKNRSDTQIMQKNLHKIFNHNFKTS